MSTIISSEKVTTQESHHTIPLQQSRKRTSHYTLYVFFVLFLATLLNGLDASEFTSASTVIVMGIWQAGLVAAIKVPIC